MEYFKSWLLQATNEQLVNEYKQLAHDLYVRRFVEASDKIDLLNEEVLKRMEN